MLYYENGKAGELYFAVEKRPFNIGCAVWFETGCTGKFPKVWLMLNRFRGFGGAVEFIESRENLKKARFWGERSLQVPRRIEPESGEDRCLSVLGSHSDRESVTEERRIRHELSGSGRSPAGGQCENRGEDRISVKDES